MSSTAASPDITGSTGLDHFWGLYWPRDSTTCSAGFSGRISTLVRTLMSGKLRLARSPRPIRITLTLIRSTLLLAMSRTAGMFLCPLSSRYNHGQSSSALYDKLVYLTQRLWMENLWFRAWGLPFSSHWASPGWIMMMELNLQVVQDELWFRFGHSISMHLINGYNYK